jgi:hypothetical protein
VRTKRITTVKAVLSTTKYQLIGNLPPQILDCPV